MFLLEMTMETLKCGMALCCFLLLLSSIMTQRQGKWLISALWLFLALVGIVLAAWLF